MRTREQIAIDVLQASIAWEPEVRVVANVTASELAALAAAAIDTCPSCGAHRCFDRWGDFGLRSRPPVYEEPRDGSVVVLVAGKSGGVHLSFVEVLP